MGDLQATIEFLVELYKFYNVDLFIRGYYQFRLTFKPPKSSHAIQVEVCESHGERGAFTLFPAFITNDGQTAVSRTFNIYYKDEEVLLKDVFLFRVHLLIDSTKAADCIDKTALEMTVDVHFTDQVVRENNYRVLPLVTSRTLKFHFSCFNGLHHQVPLLFDYYYFSVLDMIVHANVVSLGLPNWSILKQIKTGWFSKSTATPRSSTATPLFFTTLFGNRSQFGSQVSLSCEQFMEYWGAKFYNDVALRYAVSGCNSISREHFEKASAVHRNLCAILAMAHSQLLNYFDEMMQYLDKKQRIKLAEKLDPADLVEGLCKKLETLQSCEEVFDEMCGDMSVLNNELALLWFQFQESFTLNDQIRPVLREQHHRERMIHFSEAFFLHEIPWRSLLNDTDSSFQKHVSMGQCVKSSKYLSIIPPVTIECAEVDGDSSSTPIFFEDCYINIKESSVENLFAAHVHEGTEDDVLEHKPLSFGIMNRAFRDSSSPLIDSACSSDVDRELDAKDVWVDIKSDKGNDAPGARDTHAEQDATEIDCKVTDKTDKDCKRQEGLDRALGGKNSISQDIAEETRNSDPVVNSNTTRTNLMEKTRDEQALYEGDCSSKSSEGNESKVLTNSERNSEEKFIKYMETIQEVNDNLKNTCDTEGNQEHCGSIINTVDNGSDAKDVRDIIAILDTTVKDQTSDADAGIGSVIDAPLGDESQESNQNIEGDALPSERSKEKQISSIGSLGPLVVENETASLIDSKGERDILEADKSTCLIPVTNAETTVKTVEAVANDCSHGTDNGNEVSMLNKERQSKPSMEVVTNNHVVVPCTVETDKEVSSGKYVGSSDTTNCAKLESDCKSGPSVSEPGLEAGSKVKLPDLVQGNSPEKESINNINCLGNNLDEATLLIASAKKSKTESTKESECSNLTNSSSEDSLETTSNADNTSTGSSNRENKENSSNSSFKIKTKDDSINGSKKRNTAKICLAKRVSNSVFYEGVLITDQEENSSEEILQNKQISNTKLDAIRLSSNSSSDVISCFCAGRLKKVSSPYRPTSESEASNLVLQKAKQEVISRMNYFGTLYSDSDTEFLVRPYFMNPKPDLSLEPVHFVVCVHGLDGNSGDLRLLRCFLEMALPSTKFEFLMSEVNQDNTFVTFEKLTEKLVSEILHHMEAYRISPTRMSFIGHSLGNIIIRSALNHPQMEPYVELFHTFLSLSGPHLGMVHHTSSLVSTGMWLLQKWKKSDSLLQLSLNDSTDMRDTFIYKLSKKKGLEYFTNVLLVSSVQDHYVPFHSSRIELPKTLRSSSQECVVYREMMENLLTPLLSQPNRTLVRYSVYHCLPSSTNTFIGRAAHIAMLDSELFIEKLICTSAAKYFQ